MTLTEEDLAAISLLMDRKLQPIRDDIRSIQLDLENMIRPQIGLLAENYVPAARQYERSADKIETLAEDVALLKKVVTEHSEKLSVLV